jgi:hypothetical protein
MYKKLTSRVHKYTSLVENIYLNANVAHEDGKVVLN